MTRKDYIMMAEGLHDVYRGELAAATEGGADAVEGFSIAVTGLMNALKSDNPRFNLYTFMDYIKEGK